MGSVWGDKQVDGKLGEGSLALNSGGDSAIWVELMVEVDDQILQKDSRVVTSHVSVTWRTTYIH
jgi:hypothetical protein